MADTSNHGRASFWTRANALLRKNLTFQVSPSFSLLHFSLFLFVNSLNSVLNNYNQVEKEMKEPEEFWVCLWVTLYFSLMLVHKNRFLLAY